MFESCYSILQETPVTTVSRPLLNVRCEPISQRLLTYAGRNLLVTRVRIISGIISLFSPAERVTQLFKYVYLWTYYALLSAPNPVNIFSGGRS